MKELEAHLPVLKRHIVIGVLLLAFDVLLLAWSANRIRAGHTNWLTFANLAAQIVSGVAIVISVALSIRGYRQVRAAVHRSKSARIN